jgi:hypothetical protein
MKQRKTLFILLTMILSMLSIVVKADFTIDKITYHVIGNSDSVSLVNGQSITGAFTIPQVVTNDGNSYVVSSIGNSAFFSCTGLTSITIPNSVRSIGDYAFYECSGLSSITIPNSVASIGSYAYYKCTGVTNIAIPNSVTSIGERAFGYCRELSLIEIPSSITSLSQYLFYGCNKLSSVTLPNTLTSIGYDAFEDCTGLTSIAIPSSVKSIESYAFEGCTGLTSINIPSSVTSLGRCVFGNCSKLSTVILPGTYTSIGEYVFSNCTGLTSINIPSSVTSIERSAFQGCSGLTSITIPTSVTSIGESAFSSCTALASIAIPNSVTSIGESAFSGCSALSSIDIPTSVTSIGGSAFSSCTALSSVTIPTSVTTIESSTFYECSSLSLITIPTSVTSIGNYAFYECSRLTNITIPSSVTSIGSYAFYKCSRLSSIALPNSVTSIGERAFGYCRELSSIEIPSSITSLSQYLFYGCNKLSSVTLPNTLTSIGYDAFEGCTGLTSIAIPSSVKSIESYAFEGCTGLTSINIPSSVTSLGRCVFSNCSKLSTVILPNTYTSIGEYVFSNCTGLTSFTIPSSVTSIGRNAFQGCSGLTSITIPTSVTSIGESTFSSCTALTSITIPNSVTSIGENAFSSCKALTSITIPTSVTSIGESAFSSCTALTSFDMPNSISTISDDLFADCYGLKTVNIPNSVTSIGSYAFSSCIGLNSITLPNSITKIGYYAFHNTSLKHITLPNSLKIIEAWAFGSCDSLVSVNIPASVDSVGYSIFFNCNSLKLINAYGTVPPKYNKSGYLCNRSSEVVLYVPQNTKSLYSAADGWSEFTNIVEFRNGYKLSSSESGTYTYSNLSDLVSELSKSPLNCDIFVTVEPGKTFDTPLDATMSANLAMIQERLNSNGSYLFFKSDSTSAAPVLNFEVTANTSYINTFMGLKNMKLDHVKTSLSGMNINVAALYDVKSQIICSGHDIQAIDFAHISTDAVFTWQLKRGDDVKGLIESGTGSIPPMNLLDTRNVLDTVVYVVSMNAKTASDTTSLFRYDYRIIVKPNLSGQIVTSFADSTVLKYNSLYLNWDAVKDALGYTIYLWKEGEPRPLTGVNVSLRTYYSCDVSYHSRYLIQIVANGECNDLPSDTIHFSVVDIPDLDVTNITVPSSVKECSHITLTAVIKNVGKVPTVNGSRYCSLYVSRDSDLLDKSYVMSAYSQKTIAPNDTAVFSFVNVQVPPANMKSVYYIVTVSGEEEDNKSNNTRISDKVVLLKNYMQPSDYEILKRLYTSTGGDQWDDKWNTSDNEIDGSNWRGVSFDNDGHVSRLELSSNNIVGPLPDEWFGLKRLEYLNLSYNKLTGDVSPLVKNCTALKTLYLQYNRLSSVSSPLSDSITDVDLHAQKCPLDTLQKIALHRIEHIKFPSIITYDTSSRTYKNPTSLHLELKENGSRWATLRSDEDNIYSVSSTTDTKIRSGDTLYIGKDYYYNDSSFPVIFTYVRGDATVDSLVNISDVQSTLNYALNDQINVNYSYVFNFGAADTYPDDKMNVQDVVATVNLVLDNHDTLSVNGGNSNSTSAVKASDGISMTNRIYVEGNKLMLDSSTPVAVADVKLSGVSLDQLRMLLPPSRYQLYGRNIPGGVRFIILSASGNEIPVGTTAIADWSSPSVSITSAGMVDKRAVGIPVTIRNSSTYIHETNSDNISVTVCNRVIQISLIGYSGKLSAGIYDSTGKLVTSDSWNDVSDGSSRSITLNEKGIYFVKIAVDNGTNVISKQVKLIISE